jgi:hypothetical protein
MPRGYDPDSQWDDIKEQRGENGMSSYLDQYVAYIRNTGTVPLPVSAFDEDWDPIGPRLRSEMVATGLITVSTDGIRLNSARCQCGATTPLWEHRQDCPETGSSGIAHAE